MSNATFSCRRISLARAVEAANADPRDLPLIPRPHQVRPPTRVSS